MQGSIVTVFGGTGYLGSRIVKQLCEAGARVRVAARTPQNVPKQAEALPVDIREESEVATALAGASAVINAVGLYVEKAGATFGAVHVQGALHVARQAARAGAGRLVHISGIGADRGSKSPYVRARADGEEQVRKAFDNAIILRPSVLFGSNDAFLSTLDVLTRKMPIFPLFGSGATQLQPVFVGDVVRAAVAALTHAGAPGTILELGGPRRYGYRELVELVLAHRARRRVLLPVPFFIWELQALVLSVLPAPPITRDQIALMRKDNVVGQGMPSFEFLGVEPSNLESLLDECLGSVR